MPLKAKKQPALLICVISHVELQGSLNCALAENEKESAAESAKESAEESRAGKSLPAQKDSQLVNLEGEIEGENMKTY